MKNVLGTLFILWLLTACTEVNRMDLTGLWTVRLDSADSRY